MGQNSGNFNPKILTRFRRQKPHPAQNPIVIVHPGPSSLAADACPAGLALVWLLQPPGPYGGALGMWMFGLIQALYFVAVDVKPTGQSEPNARARIEKTHCRAEALLREKKLERAFEELGL